MASEKVITCQSFATFRRIPLFLFDLREPIGLGCIGQINDVVKGFAHQLGRKLNDLRAGTLCSRPNRLPILFGIARSFWRIGTSM
jgi:hypothetical protein